MLDALNDVASHKSVLDIWISCRSWEADETGGYRSSEISAYTISSLP